MALTWSQIQNLCNLIQVQQQVADPVNMDRDTDSKGHISHYSDWSGEIPRKSWTKNSNESNLWFKTPLNRITMPFKLFNTIFFFLHHPSTPELRACIESNIYSTLVAWIRVLFRMNGFSSSLSFSNCTFLQKGFDTFKWNVLKLTSRKNHAMQRTHSSQNV